MRLTQKAAMFGLASSEATRRSQFRALKKQFGELFLARMHSVAPKEVHGACVKSNRAAMFGLDTRIALAIFGALSVISGAALYSAIKEARVVALISDVEEVEKAIEAYYLDVGEFPPHATVNSGADLDGVHLKVKPSGVKGWQGPYFTDKDSTSKFIYSNHIEQASITYRDDATWPDYSSNTCTKTGGRCVLYIWVKIDDESMKRELEKRIDNHNLTTATEYSGKIRTSSTGSFFKTDLVYPNSLAEHN